jgi:hypothetical protein
MIGAMQPASYSYHFTGTTGALKFPVCVERFMSGDVGIKQVESIQLYQRCLDLIDDLSHRKLTDCIHGHGVSLSSK